MSARRSASEETDAPGVATALRDAGFVGVVARPDGDALAAAALLARALRDRDAPFQVRIDASGSADAVDADLVVTTGATGGDVSLTGEGRPASVDAYEAARALDADPDPVLALAGAVAAGKTPGAADTASVLETAMERGLLERRPGVAVPVADLVDGLAHTTLVHATFSGDADATESALDPLALPEGEATSDDDHRRVASLVAVDVAGQSEATPRAAESVERALRPYATLEGPFATLGGYADVLDAVARERPGVGVALALADRDGPNAPREAALSAWREHARTVHEAVRTARTGRSSGLTVARLEGAYRRAHLDTVARLLRDYRSSEPVALVVADGAAAAASVDPCGLAASLDEAAKSVGGAGSGRQTHATAKFDGEQRPFVEAAREAIGA